MLKIKEAILVEGRYDKNALSQVVDATIIESSGFSIFNDKSKQKLLRELASKRGLIVFTDPDGAGLVIRNFVKACVEPQYLKHAYIPEVYGKEKRKSKGSREGKLGVEGMKPQQLLDALLRAGATTEDQEGIRRDEISKADMYKKGFSGREGSAEKRAELLEKLELPQNMSAEALRDVLNVLMSREEFMEL